MKTPPCEAAFYFAIEKIILAVPAAARSSPSASAVAAVAAADLAAVSMPAAVASFAPKHPARCRPSSGACLVAAAESCRAAAAVVGSDLAAAAVVLDWAAADPVAAACRPAHL